MKVCLEKILVFTLFVLLVVISAMLYGKCRRGAPRPPAKSGGNECETVYTRVLGKKGPKPVVVFLSGLGNDNIWWNWDEGPEEIVNEAKWPRNSGIQKPIAEHTATMSFDMPGVGSSKIASVDEVPASFEDVAALVKCLLVREALPPPYVLVGHSIGGAIALVFQKIYPRDVKGVILIDSPSAATLKSIGEPEFYTKRGQLKYDITRRYLDNYSRSRAQVPFEQARALPVVAHVNRQEVDGACSDKDAAHVAFAVSAYPRVVQYVNASHWIHVTTPAPIIDSILEMVETN
jgi:pimeloyl-ACP methyl ester carboxylesterase